MDASGRPRSNSCICKMFQLPPLASASCCSICPVWCQGFQAVLEILNAKPWTLRRGQRLPHTWNKLSSLAESCTVSAIDPLCSCSSEAGSYLMSFERHTLRKRGLRGRSDATSWLIVKEAQDREEVWKLALQMAFQVEKSTLV